MLRPAGRGLRAAVRWYHSIMSHPQTPEITGEQVRKVAQLARLALPEVQVEQYRGELSAVLGYVNRLRELDLEGVEPMTSPVESVNRLAEDVPSPTLSNAQFMAIAANWSDGSENRTAAEPPFIAVPKVLGGGGEGA